MTTLPTDEDRAAIAPGSVVTVRDEEWLVTAVQTLPSGPAEDPILRVEVQGLSELVRDTNAIFLSSLDTITPFDPRQATLINDSSAGYRDSSLWLEATLRKSPLPAEEQRLAVAGGMLVDAKLYQQTPVRKILDPGQLRPRILLADAVGLGKTIEIGLILAELIRRGRGDRILIVTPKHVLEQMQHEMWTKFALPFVRLDSEGIKRIRRKLPATRNPFTYFRRAIISIDTLKNDRYLAHLRRHSWDAVVIDESHNVTNVNTLNNRLATVLAANTDALVLASATPHNGKPESFAELIRLLEPTAVHPDGSLDPNAVERLVVRRHRYSNDVKQEVGSDWAERLDPVAITVQPSPEEDAVAEELDTVWLHPEGHAPYSGAVATLFPWTLAKAFLSSPEALLESVRNRLSRLENSTAQASAKATVEQERAALQRLRNLADAARSASAKKPSGKYGALLKHLLDIGVAKGSERRAVVFAERLATVHALAAALPEDLKLPADAIAVLHGGLTDVEQQEVVESFKKASSPIRVLVTGDVASEGVNLHSQCHHLVHYDIPWSLIRIEQRNGRIDRYGQRHAPQITTLVLDPKAESFSGDIRVLQRLMEKENEAHRALGDSAALMGKYSAEAEEDAIRAALAEGQNIDEVVPDATEAVDWLALLTSIGSTSEEPSVVSDQPTARSDGLALFTRPVEFLRAALSQTYRDRQAEDPTGRDGGVRWREHPAEGIVSLVPPFDLRSRLDSLPQSYLRERRVAEELKLATLAQKGRDLVDAARNDPHTVSLWPEAHYLGALHPVLDWAADRALAAVPQRNAVYAVRAHVNEPTVVVHAGLTNRRGRTVASAYRTVSFPSMDNPDFALVGQHDDAHSVVAELRLAEQRTNPGEIGLMEYGQLVPIAVDRVAQDVSSVFEAARRSIEARVQSWLDRNQQWTQLSLDLTQTSKRRAQNREVTAEEELIRAMEPDRVLVRPLLLALPLDTPVKEETPA